MLLGDYERIRFDEGTFNFPHGKPTPRIACVPQADILTPVPRSAEGSE